MGNAESLPEDYKAKSFPGSAVGSAILDSLPVCGSLKDTDDSPAKGNQGLNRLLNQAESLCMQSPSGEGNLKYRRGFDGEYETFRREAEDDDDIKENNYGTPGRNKSASNSPANPTSALFARALVNEVTGNPKTMTPAQMTEREKKLLKAQEKAKNAGKNGDQSKPVGTSGGVGQPSVLGTIAHALTGSTDPLRTGTPSGSNQEEKQTVMPPNSMSESRAQVDCHTPEAALGKHTVTIGLSVSRRSSVGHPDTVTRQTAFDFNELQDRDYKFVSSTDSSGWRAGGGERGGGPQGPHDLDGDESAAGYGQNNGFGVRTPGGAPGTPTGENHKVAAPDTVHIPIIHIDAPSPRAVDEIIAALARGEIFIPHMAIIPEALSVDGVSPPDLVVRFGTERNEDLPPDEWPNWCLEFMHNQLYEYFQCIGARWMKRPFSITLAKKVRWKTVKHMNRYFAHAERVIDAWREKGPQYLDPQLAYIEGGATPEEVARPHGIYLLRNGVPTNYFAPNFDPPYTTKMTRSLLMNVLGKSWDKKRREWTSEPIPKLITPSMLVSVMCGCGDSNGGGFVANEVTLAGKIDTSTIPQDALIRSDTPKTAPPQSAPKQQKEQQEGTTPKQDKSFDEPQSPSMKSMPQTPSMTEPADTDIVSVSNHRNTGMKTPSNPHMRVNDAGGRNYRNQNGPAPIDVTNGDSNQNHDSMETGDQDDLNESSSPTQDRSLHSQSVSPRYGKAPAPETALSPSMNSREEDEDEDQFPSSHTTEDRSKTSDNISTKDATSDHVQASQAGTGTTIMHMNLSAEKLMNREFERRTARDEKKEEDISHEDPDNLISDEDWLDQLGKPLPSPAVNENLSNNIREKNNAKEALEKERSRQIALIAMAQEQTARAQEHLERTLSDPAKREMAEALMSAERTERASRTTGRRSNNNYTNHSSSSALEKSYSGISLQYSVDSTLLGDQSTIGNSTLMGQNYATDASVNTASTKDTKESKVSSQIQERLLETSSGERDEEDTFSLQESTSSVEVVPTDEELFAVGWAKALDPKSGSYYFFTLDRTKIVWDNPLANGQSCDSAESPYPEGNVAI